MPRIIKRAFARMRKASRARAPQGAGMHDLTTLLGLAGSVRLDHIESKALKDNAIGDPSRRILAVYTPPGYDAEASKRYPVMYCLHGYTGDVGALLATRPWETNVVQWIDRLITTKAMPPAILAVVDGNTRLGGSQYIDSVHNGKYTQYVIDEIVPHMDRTYRTIAHEGGRAVLGKSSGGFGALYLSMVRPGVFGAFASHSGDTYFRYASMGGFVNAQRTLEAHGGSIAAFVEAFETKNKRSQAEYNTIEMIGYASAYSPRAAKQWAIDMPFDLATGELREDIFAKWLAFDPVEMCVTKTLELGRMRFRYVDCGRRDEYGLDLGARILVARMRDMGLAVEHQEFDDDHRNVGYRYAVSLPALADALDKA
jgi:enterochelin esterase family protein